MKCFETLQSILYDSLTWKGMSICFSIFFFFTMFEEIFCQETNVSASKTYTSSFMTFLVFFHANSVCSCRLHGTRARTEASLNIPLPQNSYSTPHLLRKLPVWLNDGKSCASLYGRLMERRTKALKYVFLLYLSQQMKYKAYALF